MEANKAITVLDGITPAVEAIPIAGPSLVGMLGVAKQVCQAVDGARMNREAYEQLAEEVAKYASAISKAIQSDSRFLPGLDHAFDLERSDMMEEVDKLTAVFREVLKLIEDRRKEEKKRRRKVLGRLRQRIYEAWHKDDDAENVKILTRKVDNNIKTFNIVHDVRGLKALENIEYDIKAIAAAHPDLLKQELAPVLSARFDWHGMPEGCLPDTRVDLLHQIRTWILDDSPSSPHLFALTGLAGTGKTTVAQSVCIEFDRKRTTVSFFVSRSFAEHRHPENIVRTIAYQIAACHTSVRSAVFSALRNGRDVTTRPLSEQVESLIMTPLRAMTDPASRVLIVIDALDECNKVDQREGGEIIPLLASGIRQLPVRVKLLITSREEPKLMEMLRELGLDAQEDLVRLQNIEDKFVKKDVRAYFTYHFRRISESNDFKDLGAWPSEDSLELLVELTGKLFVFAALMVRIMCSPRINPKKRLDEILRPLSSSIYNSNLQPLDELYLDVLTKATSNGEDPTDEEVLRRVRNTVGTLVLLQSPLSANALSGILEEEAFLIWGDIEHLSAVLMVPDTPHESVTIFHPSFRDYVLTCCTDRHFWIDPADYSVFLVRCCLVVMNRGLKRDICNIGDPSIMNEEISDFNQRRDLLISLELQYACEYWMTHLSDASHPEDRLIEDFNTFCCNHLLHWIEALSLLNKLSAGAVHLPAAITWCKRHLTSVNNGILALLEDIERVVLAYDIPIRAGALQVYCSTLVFMPSCYLYQIIKSEAIGTVQLISERHSTWPASRRTIEGHTEHVLSVAFSPDGTRIASGSGDSTVRVWDVSSGRGLAQLKGHAHWVLSVSFSPDGARVVSGSEDMTVRVWDVVSGHELIKFTGHTAMVWAVAFSPDGTRIASGSWDNTVRVWDAYDGHELAQLNGHTDSVESIAFSPDGSRIASGSSDNTVRVWDSISGCELSQINGHNEAVRSVAFSPDGTKIATGSNDTTVRVWDVVGECELALFNGHTSHAVLSVAFSPNGRWIASSSRDKTVCVWDVISGHKVTQLTGHTDSVWSATFSPDGNRIASGSWDKTVRLWDIVSNDIPTQLRGHDERVWFASISSNATCIVTGSDDKTIRVWDPVGGHELAQLNGYADRVNCIALSPNGTRIVTGSDDTIVQVWDAFSGQELAQLNGHTDAVYSVAFSPSGASIASGSEDTTMRIWDIVNGRELARFHGHTSRVASIEFSPNGAYIASGSWDGTVRVWDVDSGRELAQLRGHTNRVGSVTFSLRTPETRFTPDLEGKDMQMWDTVSDAKSSQLDKNPNQIWSGAFSQHSTQIILTGTHGEKRLWYEGVDFQTSNPRSHESISYTSPTTLLMLNNLIYDGESGWLTEKKSKGNNVKRLCWIPPERQGLFEASNSVVVFGSNTGIVTILSVCT